MPHNVVTCGGGRGEVRITICKIMQVLLALSPIFHDMHASANCYSFKCNYTNI